MSPSEAFAKVQELFPDRVNDVDSFYISGWYDALRGYVHTKEDYGDCTEAFMGYCDCLGVNLNELD